MEFDFDYWKNLQEENPERFETERSFLISNYIQEISSDEKRVFKATALQAKINTERRKYKRPIDSAGRIYNMMFAEFQELRKGLNTAKRMALKADENVLKYTP